MRFSPPQLISLSLLKRVFVVFRILEHGIHVLFPEFLRQPLPHDPLPLVQFLDGDEAFVV